MRSRLSRSARTIACSTALASCAISVLGVLLPINSPSWHFVRYVVWSQRPEGTNVPNCCLTSRRSERLSVNLAKVSRRECLPSADFGELTTLPQKLPHSPFRSSLQL